MCAALENKNKSGIYMLTNKLTNDIYIGQSIKSNLIGSFFNADINNFYQGLSGLSDA